MGFNKLTPEEKKMRADQRKQKTWEERHKIINDILYKWCPHGQHWVIEDDEHWYKNSKNTIDGYYPNCIQCEIERTQIWRQNNPEWYKELNHITNTNPSDKTREAYRKNNKTRRENGKYQEWLNNNPEKTFRYMQDRYHKNHRITKEEWIACKNYFNNSCAYCGLPLEEHYRIYAGELQKIDLHKEHVDHEGSNTLANCIPSCQSCNDSKWKFQLNYWYNENNPNFTLERYNRIIKWLEEDHKKYIQPTKPKQKYVRKIKQETA